MNPPAETLPEPELTPRLAFATTAHFALMAAHTPEDRLRVFTALELAAEKMKLGKEARLAFEARTQIECMTEAGEAFASHLEAQLNREGGK